MVPNRQPVGFIFRELPYFVTHERILAANIVGAPCHHLAQHSGTLDSIKHGLERALLEYARRRGGIHPGTSSGRPFEGFAERHITDCWRTAGCPSGPQWKRGQRTHDSENYNTKNNWNREFSALTRSSLSRDIRLNFCPRPRPARRRSPSGRPVLLSLPENDCPSGFQTSYVDHDDEDFWNGNLVNGVLPDGLYLHDTRLHCRKDGARESRLNCRRRSRFFAAREYEDCQLVLGMSVTEHFSHGL
ncbi:hypothetical protein BV898_04167 [Hypsibius exemplaris]|uniref:Apextrin C-terminal domain-containing protein n=1 Tax=Hypsibius exemplaris TaxID=2072580 RepID=A0A1W0X388_HYPEX|nr:hypothetical protein BV898_04167 [Hypsibius exemplaris]